MGALDFVDDDKDLEDALKHLVFDLLTTSTFKVDAQEEILGAVQLQCTRSVSASAVAGGGSAGLGSSQEKRSRKKGDNGDEASAVVPGKKRK